MRVETLVLIAVALMSTVGSLRFFGGLLAGRDLASPRTWLLLGATVVGLAALQALPVLLIATRHTARPLLSLLLLCTLIGGYFMQQFGVVLDTSMLRNALRTDTREAVELLTARFFMVAAVAAVLIVALWRVRLQQVPWRRAVGRRLLFVGLTLLVALACLLAAFRDLAPLMRNQKDLRYTILPWTVPYATGMVLTEDWRASREQPEPPQPVQRTAVAAQPGGKPRLLVLAIGETTRAANWGLDGYRRDTTPQLAKLRAAGDLVNFGDVTSCGTNTETSLPCMFSAFGRLDGYDEKKIRRSESLLHLLDRAGVHTVWLDNQSGCKGVCKGLDSRDLSREVGHAMDPALCDGERCYDGILPEGLQAVLKEEAAAPRDLVVVLHLIGNHGPAYYKRYPDDAAVFQPACTDEELRKCSDAAIVNAYDNGVRYTDTVLKQVIDVLRTTHGRYQAGMIYVSDHGESLGEHGLYLHGMPYALAPDVQTHVPMVWWFDRQGGSNGQASFGLDTACIAAKSAQPASHDNLFHTVLSLMATTTPRWREDLDLTQGCMR